MTIPPETTDIRIVGVTAADCERLTAIASAAKAHWGYPAEWLEEWRSELTFRPHDIETWEVFAARLHDQLYGVAAVCVAGELAALEHLWVDPEVMGRGIGRLLLAHAAERARKLGAHRLEILSDPNAAGFYAHQGAEHVRDHHTSVLGLPRALPVYELNLIT